VDLIQKGANSNFLCRYVAVIPETQAASHHNTCVAQLNESVIHCSHGITDDMGLNSRRPPIKRSMEYLSLLLALFTLVIMRLPNIYSTKCCSSVCVPGEDRVEIKRNKYNQI